MGGPIGAGNGDWLPRTEQRMQPRVQQYAGEDDDIAAQAQAYARQAAQYAQPQQHTGDQETWQPPQPQVSQVAKSSRKPSRKLTCSTPSRARRSGRNTTARRRVNRRSRSRNGQRRRAIWPRTPWRRPSAIARW